MIDLFKSPHFVKSSKLAFTLAEVLITLGIIGIVAAMTIPTLVNNSQKKSYVVALKKFYSTQNNGWKELLAADGVEKLEDTTAISLLPGGSCDVNDASSNSDCANFWKELQKYFKFKIVQYPFTYTVHGLDGSNLGSYGSSKSFLAFPDGSTSTIAQFWKDADNRSHSASVVKSYGGHMFYQQGQITVDVNGFNKPNVVGRDIYYFTLSDDGVLYPQYGKDFSILFAGNDYSNTWQHINYCGNNPDDTSGVSSSMGLGCAARIMESGWEMNY